jgi:hypothetical protein
MLAASSKSPLLATNKGVAEVVDEFIAGYVDHGYIPFFVPRLR